MAIFELARRSRPRRTVICSSITSRASCGLRPNIPRRSRSTGHRRLPPRR
jgi:hypothetical protein